MRSQYERRKQQYYLKVADNLSGIWIQEESIMTLDLAQVAT